MTSDPSPPPPAPSADDAELFRIVVESTLDFAIFTLDEAGIVTSWNVGAERVLGLSRSEMIGRPADVIFTPEDRAAGIPEFERRTALAEGRAEDERWHLRRDGSRFWAQGQLLPLRDSVPGFAKIIRDRTEAFEAEHQLRENEERFRLLATSIPQLVFRSRGDGSRTWGSPQWEAFTGLSDDESRAFGWLGAVHPDDRDATLAAWRTAQETGAYHVEHRIRWAAKDEDRWHQTRARPLAPLGDRPVEWVGTSTDIHDLRLLQDRQQILLAELHHRTRNLLAVVQSLARKTMRSSETLVDFSAEFERRLRALSRVQGLLARMDYDAIDLRTVIEAELTAHGSGGTGKVRVEGPPVSLPAPAAQALALGVHELATNAVKYGALHHEKGRLAVTWEIEAAGEEPCVTITWRESGIVMPDPRVPRRKGYGSELIERSLPYQLRARTSLAFGADGVICTITLPVPATAKENGRG
ncbi:sensor histidine kinase [Methylobacterium oryzisoli]|uniref:sensor histidine kinase n=1 Tax=Methylobacterium oryzisoli TaxID=3385502 RepID=UPI00389138F4